MSWCGIRFHYLPIRRYLPIVAFFCFTYTFSDIVLGATRPNVVFVLIDDLGWGDFSCFGNQLAKTPHIDRLAAEGIRFSQFYVNSPICSPSRTAFTTGQYPQRWKVTSYLSHRAENTKRGMAQWLDPQAPVLARMLHDGGYATGHFGKWHLGGQRDVGEAPLITEYGFDESLTNFEGLGPRLLPLGHLYNGTSPKRHALGSDLLGRGPIIWQDRSTITAGFAGAAIEFMKKAALDQRPFYVNLWPDDVHAPFFPSEMGRKQAGNKKLYHVVLEELDTQLGLLFDTVRNDPKLRDNTLILVCSDNGPDPGHGSAGPFRGTKGTLFEGGVRSPLIAWGPGIIPVDRQGTLNETSVIAAIDIAPSLLSLAGVVPNKEVLFDGENVLEGLIGRSSAPHSRIIFWRRPPDRKIMPKYDVGELPDLAVRDGDWKLLCDYDGSKAQLYNLKSDPAETNNIVSGEPERAQKMTTQLLAWHRSLPEDNGQAYFQETQQRQKTKKGTE